LSHTFPLQNGLKQRDALSLLHLNVALEYAIRNIKKNTIETEWDTSLFGHANDVTVLGDNINTINKNTEAL
jgi:hypothetical protein